MGAFQAQAVHILPTQPSQFSGVIWDSQAISRDISLSCETRHLTQKKQKKIWTTGVTFAFPQTRTHLIQWNVSDSCFAALLHQC